MKKNSGLCLILLLLSSVLFSCKTFEKQDFKQVNISDKNKTLIYFYRDKSIIGAFVDMKVLMDRKELGVLSTHDYFYAEVEPGEHNFIVKANYDSTGWIGRFNNNFKVGESYFIIVKGINMELVPMNKGISYIIDSL